MIETATIKDSSINTVKTVSFDVFDTLLTRTTSTPKGIFAIMQKRLKSNSNFSGINPYLRENFYIIRTESESFLRNHYAKYGINEITFDEIYSYIQKNYDLTVCDIKILKELEIETERQNLIGIDENIEKVKRFLNEGTKVIIISDIYHSSNTIRSFLTDKDPIFSDIPIYVSSEARKMKATGELYTYVSAKEQINGLWLHIGDNINSDIKAAKNLGIQTEIYPYTHLKDYEKKLLARYPEDAYTQLAIGTAKNTRIFSKSDNKKFELGCSMGGLILYPYVSWITEQSVKRGINRLYFVMRDGFILKEMCDILIKEKNYSIKTKLLYGSREAWRAPSITADNTDLSFMFASAREINTIEKIASRFHIKISDLIKFIPEEFRCSKKVFSKPELDKLCTILSENPDFIDLVVRENKQQQNYLIEYIKQEMDLSDNNFALVDLAASGRTQNCLVKLIKTFSNVKVTSFYSQFNPLKILSPDFDMIAFYSSPKIRSQMELFCRSLCGATISYKEVNNNIIPVMEDLEGESLKQYDYQAVLDGEKAFCRQFFHVLNKNPDITPNLKGFLFYFDYITGVPDRETAELIGEIPFSNYYGTEKKVYKCAQELTLKDIILGYDSTQIQLPNICYIRSKKFIRKLLDIRKKYGSIRKYLVNIEIHRRRKQAYFRVLGLEVNFGKFIF